MMFHCGQNLDWEKGRKFHFREFIADLNLVLYFLPFNDQKFRGARVPSFLYPHVLSLDTDKFHQPWRGGSFILVDH